ncbi:hypothetical protein K438DRAFT_1787944 [Mycena galopus ATCC 62051]|nr:hypothetical protein K438DRAFT_1787944 [Mycena galopus ATCC 62051]
MNETSDHKPSNTCNDLTGILQTLSSAAHNIPSVPELSSAVDRLLDPATRAGVLTGGHGLLILAKTLETVGAIVSKYGPGQTRAVKSLQREVQSIAKDLNNALSQGKLGEFLDSDTRTSLAKHSMNLTQRLLDYMKAITVFHGGKVFVGQHFHGNTGIGGDGGDAEGPRVEGNAGATYGNISGGIGGAGGAGIDAGGKGRTGIGADHWTELPSQRNLQRGISVFLALLSIIRASYSTSNEARNIAMEEKRGPVLAKNMIRKKHSLPQESGCTKI